MTTQVTDTLGKLSADATAFLNTHEEWERLTNEEITHLRAKDFKEATKITRRKADITTRYQKQLKQLFDQKEALALLPIVVKDALKKSQLVFEKISADYQRELDLALNASRRFIETVKNAITRQTATSFFYGYSGALKLRHDVPAMVYNSCA